MSKTFAPEAFQTPPVQKACVATGDYHTEASNKHVFKCALVQSMAFWHEAFRADHPPGPGTYTLPRLMGPNTAYTNASPCYSMKRKSKNERFDADLSKESDTPGPAAFPKIEVDTYKRRAPIYTTGAQTKLGGDRTVKPGPADYRTGKVTLIKPQAPETTFGIRHSIYTTPLIVE
ncbi:outer dense fiber protein 3-like [Aythya fuligula]|uniref:Outer dense fiber protein 3-like n=1 Tax=Aythya fuligula TaxID=219594 RepID=A0A6J3D2Y3_AYTFU|nr:outer dense fiber protein 3-like [Aythya fuligula]